MELEDLVVKSPLQKETGLTIGIDIPGRGSYVFICGECGAGKNNFKVHPNGDFMYCLECNKVQALKAGCNKPGCPCEGGRAGTH